jgi:cytochrome c heme-lyase
MGNSVSAAQNVATHIVGSATEPEITQPKHHHKNMNLSGMEPPPECPMHKKEVPKEKVCIIYFVIL